MKRAHTSQSDLKMIENWDEVPAFTDEAQEAAFWDTHTISEALADKMHSVPRDGGGILPPARPRTKPIPIRFDDTTLARLKALAARRNRGYQTIVREFIAERLYEEEKREGIL